MVAGLRSWSTRALLARFCETARNFWNQCSAEHSAAAAPVVTLCWSSLGRTVLPPAADGLAVPGVASLGVWAPLRGFSSASSAPVCTEHQSECCSSQVSSRTAPDLWAVGGGAGAVPDGSSRLHKCSTRSGLGDRSSSLHTAMIPAQCPDRPLRARNLCETLWHVDVLVQSSIGVRLRRLCAPARSDGTQQQCKKCQNRLKIGVSALSSPPGAADRSVAWPRSLPGHPPRTPTAPAWIPSTPGAETSNPGFIDHTPNSTSRLPPAGTGGAAQPGCRAEEPGQAPGVPPPASRRLASLRQHSAPRRSNRIHDVGLGICHSRAHWSPGGVSSGQCVRG